MYDGTGGGPTRPHPNFTTADGGTVPGPKSDGSSPRRDGAARHADHEMSQFLRLHLEMPSERFASLDEHIQRAIYVAYATHVRVLLEFFHEGTKKWPNNRGADFRVADLSREMAAEWDATTSERWREATRLAAHISGERPNLTGIQPFGSSQDFEMIGCRIFALLGAIADARKLLPGTVNASEELRRRLPSETGRCE